MNSAKPITFVNVTAILSDRLIENAVVVCHDGVIQSVDTHQSGASLQGNIIDGRGGYLSPGYIDIHVHGGGGADFMDGSVEAVRTACIAHARHGTTTLFPTTTTGSPASIFAMFQAVQQAQGSWDTSSGARIAGIHLYGPYFAEDKVGCHSLSGRRSPEASEYEDYFASNLVRIATCAAELPGALDFYRAAAKHRCLITCGHSNASWPEMQQAYDCGMRHVDHFWCAMSNVASVRARLGVPMRGSMLEFVLGNQHMSTEVIADGQHLAPELLDFAYRLKGSKKLCLVTDCNRAMGMPPGRYLFGNQQEGTWFESDLLVGRAPNGSLASSIQGMDHMVRQMARDTSAPLYDVVRMASLTPAELTSIDNRTGSIEKGKQADLLLLDTQLNVQQVYIAGLHCHNSTTSSTRSQRARRLGTPARPLFPLRLNTLTQPLLVRARSAPVGWALLPDHSFHWTIDEMRLV